MKEGLRTYCILGARGFIGKHLITSEYASKNDIFHLLSRKHAPQSMPNSELPCHFFAGDLKRPFIQDGFIVPGATVVNLAYIAGDDISENLNAADYLVETCILGRADRLIHCSTATVAGSVTGHIVDEKTACHPVTSYECCKLAIEHRLIEKCRNRLDLIILRPTAVFGVGGKNLNSTIDFIARRSSWQRSLRMSVFQRRRMNLVSVENVAAAIHFLAHRKQNEGVERYIVSEDDDVANTFSEVCRMIHEVAEKPLPTTFPVPFNRSILKILVKMRHGTSAVPDRRYSRQRLASAGFRLPFAFDERVRCYVTHYLQARTDGL